MRTRLGAAVMAAMLLGHAVYAQSVPEAPSGQSPGGVTPAVVPGPLGFTPPPPPPDAPAAGPTVHPEIPPPSVGGIAPPPPPPDTPGVLPVSPAENAAGGLVTGPGVEGEAWPVYPAQSHHRSFLVRERLRLLDTTLIPLAERSHDARITEGILGLVAGAAMVALGVLVGPDTADGSIGLNSLLYLSGGFSLLQGGLDLFWVPARETLGRQYESMPRGTAVERRAQVRFGEQALEDMASDGARRRVLGALGNVVMTLGMLAAIYNQQIFNGASWGDPTMNYLVLGISGISLITSVIGLFSRSDEERLRDTYQQTLNSLREIPATD